MSNAAAILKLKDDPHQDHNKCGSNSPPNTNGDDSVAVDSNCFGKPTQQRVVLVGLHPDEVTEVIIDAALAHRLPFAVVPCCVYSRLFPHRRHPDGQSVRTHERLVQYLQAKAPRIRREQLSFGGQATVLYHLGDYDS